MSRSQSSSMIPRSRRKGIDIRKKMMSKVVFVLLIPSGFFSAMRRYRSQESETLY